MNEIFLGFIFDKEKEKALSKENKVGLQIAANQYQQGFLKGMKRELNIVSVLPTGTFPKTSKKLKYLSDTAEILEGQIKYISFVNFYGLKEISQKKQLIKEITGHLSPKEENIIYVYSLYMPFFNALKFLKKKFANIKICLIIPDLPGKYGIMRKSFSLGGIRDRIEADKKMELAEIADSYVFLTEAMKDVFPKKPYTVIEGFLPTCDFPANMVRQPKTILYTGSLNPSFGIRNLIEAFRNIDDSDYELWICGAGGIQNEIESYAREDCRIKYFGFLPKTEISILQSKCDVLVNPRSNKEEYTKYSFPSKTMEYVLSGSKVVMYPLAGIPEEYFEFINIIEGNSISDLKDALVNACEDTEFYKSKSKKQIEWISKEKTFEKQVSKLKSLNL